MRVLQITAFCNWGCTGRIAVGINNAIVSYGDESLIAWGRKNTADNSIHTIKVGNVFDQYLHCLYTRISDRCGFGSKKVTEKFIERIEEHKPDLIQLHILHGYYINLEVLFNYIKKKNIPTVWTFHDCWAFTGHCPYFDLADCVKWKSRCFECPQKKHHPASWCLDNSLRNWKQKRRLFTGIENLTIVTPSKWMATLVKKSFFKNVPVKVINNGINIKDFRKDNSIDINIKYKIPNKKIVLGVSGSWAESKGLNDFIRLSNLLPSDYIIVIVGLSKSQKKKLPGSIIGIERTDNVKELARLYSAAHVFVNPTYEDNYPTTNLEALACGTPVITYNTGGSPEIIEKTGCGVIVDQGDITGLVNAILKIKNDIAEKLDRSVLSDTNRFAEYYDLYISILTRNI